MLLLRELDVSLEEQPGDPGQKMAKRMEIVVGRVERLAVEGLAVDFHFDLAVCLIMRTALRPMVAPAAADIAGLRPPQPFHSVTVVL